MKNKKLLIITIVYFILSVNLFSKEINFKAKKMDIKDGGDTILAYFSKTNIPDKKIDINSNKVNYNKKSETIIFSEEVTFKDNENLISIESNKIKYEKKKDLVYSHGDTTIIIKNNYKINSKNLYFDRNQQIIYGNKKAVIYDSKENIFPILKGRSSFSNDDELKVYKGVFSTCNIENKKCRGWELNTEEFKHDKKNKIFEYKNSWLKVFNFKIFYLPYFNHPDPSVKRKSGLLTPSYTSSDSLGTSINLPYFKILSVDKDITFNPRFYADGSFLLQNEYRQALQNSNILSDFSFLVGDAGTKGHLFYNQLGKMGNTNYEINLQDVRGDNYLKTHKLIDTSPLIENDGLLISSLDLNWNLDNSKLSTSFKIFEDLSRNYHDRFQYIFPDFNYSKNL